MKRFFFFFLLFSYSFSSFAQRFDNTETFRSINRDKYFRFHYDNDYFTKTDRYYSQGITLEYLAPGLKNFFLSKILLKPFNTSVGNGITLNLFAFTPTSIESDSILYGDRPFDANISLQTFQTQVDPLRRQKISSSISIGVMGRPAFGYDIQYGIHKWTSNPLPKGWQYQIANDAIINYQVNYEKELIGSGNHFSLNATGEGRVGTLNDKLNAGFNLMVGQFNDRYDFQKPVIKRTEYYFYLQGRGNIIGYDATMQGGVFNRKSPYTIPNSAINRFVFQADAGVVVNFRKLYLSYTQSYITKEFKTGVHHRWGGVSIGFAL